MKKLIVVLLPFFFITSSFKDNTNFVKEPKLIKLSCRIHTLGENKDWDTQLGLDLYYKNVGRNIAELLCCSSGRPKGADHGTTFDDNKDAGEWDLKIKEELTKNQFDKSEFEVSIIGKKNDKWQFDVALHAEFSDHTTRDYTWKANELNSIGKKRAGVTFKLGERYEDETKKMH